MKSSKNHPVRRSPGRPKGNQPANARTKLWRHPQKPAIRVPERAAVTIAVMETGLTDYATIASAVGLTVDEVRRIDLAEDAKVRQLSVQGIPHGIFFTLRRKIRCPKCDAWITIAPCVACGSRRGGHPAPDEEAD